MVSAKMATAGFFRITVFWNKVDDVIIPVDDVTNNILLRDSNYIVDLLIWPKFGNSSISLREVIRKTAFFEGWTWFKFNNLGLTLGTNLKFSTSVAKGLQLKARMFWGLIPTFVKVAGENW